MNNDSVLPPTILIIFGITGDLSHRYLLPALNEIAAVNKLPEEFKIIGVSRRQITTSDLFHEDEQHLQKYGEPLQMDLDSIGSYENLRDKINEISSGFKNQAEVIYYLAVPPSGVMPIIHKLGEAGLNSPNAKLLLEKPFGVNLETAQDLIAETQG
jgi:glucose-6-phosphate 1-dehydrogenase